MIGESFRSAKRSQYFKCQDYSHIARNPLIKESDDEIETVIYEPTGSATDFDDDVMVYSIQLGIVRCSHTADSNEN